jgi:multiple sugar transport system substrate-binding protein
MKRKPAPCLAMLLFIIALLLAACAVPAAPAPVPAAPGGEVAPGRTELVVWAEGNTVNTMESDPEGQGRYARYLIEKFEEEHPGVTVKLEHHGWDEELRQNLVTALLANNAPDIVVGENFFQQYAELGALISLDEYITDKDNLIPGTYAAGVFQDKVYGLSAFTGVFGFERNCTVIEAAGLDCDTPPATWDELLAQAQQISEAGDGAYYGYTLQGPVGFSVGGIFRIAVYLAQAGAPMCKDDCTYPYFNNPDAVPVMQFLREINRFTPPGLTFDPDEGRVYSQLFNGLSAYQIAGSWHVGWAKSSGCEDCRYSGVPVPEGGQPASIIVGNVMYAVLQQSKNPALAAEFIEFMTRDDVQDLVYPTLGRLPSTRSALTKLRPNVDEATQAFIDQLLNNPELGILPQWRKDPQKLWSIYNDMLIRVLSTEDPIEEIMNDAQDQADAVMAQN